MPANMSLDTDLPPPPPYSQNDPLASRPSASSASASASFGTPPGVPLSTHIIALRLRGGDIPSAVPTYEQANPPPPVPLDREIIALRLRGGDISATAPPYEQALRDPRPPSQDLTYPRPPSQEISSPHSPTVRLVPEEQEVDTQIPQSDIPSTPPPIASPIAPDSPLRLNINSAAQYFEERAADIPPPSELVEHQMTIYPRSTAKDFAKIPHCWRARTDAVSQQDWKTFVNYVFPPDQAPQAQIPRKVREDMERYVKPGTPQTVEQRRERMEAVIAEWNEGFFGPRSLIIDFRFVTGLLDAPASPLCPRCYPTGDRSVARKPLTHTQSSSNTGTPLLPPIQTLPPLSLSRGPSTSDGPSSPPAPRNGFAFSRTQTTPISAFAGSSQQSPSSPGGPAFINWIERISERAQTYGQQISEQAARHGDAMERRASRHGDLIQRHANRHGESIQQHARRFETFGDQLSNRLAGPARPRSGRWDPWDTYATTNGSNSPAVGTSNNQFRRRSGSVSSITSRTSSSSDSSFSSLSSRDFEGVDLDGLRGSFATFISDPNRTKDLHMAVRELRADLRSKRRRDTHHHRESSAKLNTRSDSFKARRAEIKATRKDLTHAIKECKRERKEMRRERRLRHKERKEARRVAKKEKKDAKRAAAVKAGKKKSVAFPATAAPTAATGSGTRQSYRQTWNGGNPHLARTATMPMSIEAVKAGWAGTLGADAFRWEHASDDEDDWDEEDGEEGAQVMGVEPVRPSSAQSEASTLRAIVTSDGPAIGDGVGSVRQRRDTLA